MRKKIRYFDLAHFQLMPGPVGLHIVESFAMLKPLATTNLKTHGPEIAYLKKQSKCDNHRKFKR